MVLESILRPKKAEDKPLYVFIIAFFYSLVSVFFAMKLFPSASSMLTVALITIIFVPFFHKLFSFEERIEDAAARGKKVGNLFSRHRKVIITFSAFFLGIIFALSFLFIFVQEAQPVFALQAETLRGFHPSGLATEPASDFSRYFFNNSQVLLLIFALSILFGAGAVFIIVWNASVIAAYLGLIVQSKISQGLSSGIAYLYGIPMGLGSIALHGIPEIVAYFFAGIAGGVLSVGIMKENFNSPEFREIFIDSLIFLMIGEVFIILAAWLEAVL